MIPRELNDQYKFLDIDVNIIDHNEIGVLGCIYDFYLFFFFVFIYTKDIYVKTLLAAASCLTNNFASKSCKILVFQ